MFSLTNFLNPQIQSETSASEKDLNDAMNKLGHLGHQIKALKAKQANNSMVAARAKDTATMAQNKANEAKQVCVCFVLHFIDVLCTRFPLILRLSTVMFRI